MRKSLFILAAVSTLTLSACATTNYEKDPLYDAGFSDGCSTGTARTQGAPASKPIRDESDWKASDAYRAGWKAGYSSCAPQGGTRGDTTGKEYDPTRH
jgi:hypothetical protein